MKTNVVMLSPSRELFGIKIRQESKTGHLNLSDLQAAYAVAQTQHGWVDKNLTMLLNSAQNAERIFYILEKQQSVKLSFLSFMEDADSQGVIKLLKAGGKYKTTGRGANKTTWCDPYIWVLVAMELNPMLYAQTVIWLTDGLILNRIEAGNMFRGLSSEVAKFQDADYSAVARALNFVVFGKHETGIRQTATVAQLKELVSLEENMAFAIRRGFIRNQGHLLDALRDTWRDKFNRAVLAA